MNTNTAAAAAATVENTEIQALLAKIKALETAAAAAKVMKSLSFKVSEKGALSVYGMGRFPVTLYAEQWDRLFAHADDVKAFIAAHRSEFKAKGEEKPATA